MLRCWLIISTTSISGCKYLEFKFHERCVVVCWLIISIGFMNLSFWLIISTTSFDAGFYCL